MSRERPDAREGVGLEPQAPDMLEFPTAHTINENDGASVEGNVEVIWISRPSGRIDGPDHHCSFPSSIARIMILGLLLLRLLLLLLPLLR